MKSYLVFPPDPTYYFFPFLDYKNVTVEKPFISIPKQRLTRRIIKKILKTFHITYFQPIITGEWINHINDYDCIIVFDTAYSQSKGTLCKLLKKYRGEKYLFFGNPYFSNPIDLKLAKKHFTIYSFDKEDCNKYHLSYNPSVFSSKVISETRKIEYDICYVGYSKDRLETLKSLFDSFSNNGLISKFVVISSQDSYLKENFTIQKDRISYQNYLDIISRSSAILDIPQNGQDGISMRILEAVFLKKKYITTNQNVKNLDIYSPNNIFILGHDNQSNITQFINSQFMEIDKKILNKYDFISWLETFKP